METILKELWKVQYNANYEMFVEIFDITIGNHLYQKFVNEDRNLLNWYKGLDDESREKLTEYLKKQFVTMF